MAFRNKAFEKGTPLQIHFYARGSSRTTSARTKLSPSSAPTPQKNPNAWVVHTGMARVYSGERRL